MGAACLRSRGDIAFRALQDQHRAPEVQLAANSHRGDQPRCCTVVVPAFMSPEIGTQLALKASTTPATQKSSKTDFLSPNVNRFVIVIEDKIDGYLHIEIAAG